MRLSESPIWRIQKKAYACLGVQSWAKERVPFHITNNARIAAQYASIVHAAFGRKPCTILEVGGGSGKFAYLFLLELLRKGCKVRYFLTDAAEKNVLFWNEHPLFSPMLKKGILQTVLYNPLEDGAFAEAIDVAVANYFFDSIPQDLFRVEQGKLCEGVIDVEQKAQDCALFPEYLQTYLFRPLESGAYPDWTDVEEVLAEYKNCVEKRSFLFPIGALRAFCNLCENANRHFFLLAADRGVCKSEFPLLSLHGDAFSLPVDFRALSRYAEKKGGEAVFFDSSLLDFTVALVSKNNIPLKLAHRFKKEIFGPLKKEAGDGTKILECLEEAHWDATLFFSLFDRVQDCYESLKDFEKQTLLIEMGYIREQFFPVFHEEVLLLDRLGLFFQTLGREEDAVRCFEKGKLLRLLPKQISLNFPFLDSASLGTILHIGDISADQKKCETHKNDGRVAWNELTESLGFFDSIFFILSEYESSHLQKPSIVREIEDQFPFLNQLVYSDADIEAFFLAIGKEADEKRILHFFMQLERKKNISREQFERILKRFGKEDSSFLCTGDALYQTLKRCLKNHMNKGSIFYAFLPGTTGCFDPRIFEEVIVNPSLEYEEKEDVGGVWIKVRKL